MMTHPRTIGLTVCFKYLKITKVRQSLTIKIFAKMYSQADENTDGQTNRWTEEHGEIIFKYNISDMIVNHI